MTRACLSFAPWLAAGLAVAALSFVTMPREPKREGRLSCYGVEANPQGSFLPGAVCVPRAR